MNMKTIKILAAVTAPVTLAAIFWPAPGSSVATTQSGGALLPALKSGFAEVAAITVTGPGGTVKLARATASGKPAEGWVVTDKANYPVQVATLQPVLEGLRALRGLEAKTERPKLYSRLELEDPSKTANAHGVTLLDAKGTAIGSVILGRQKDNTSPGGGEQQYARTPGNPRAWLAAPAITLPDAALAWIDHSIVNIEAEKIQRAVITQADGATVEFKRAKPEDKLALQTAVPAGRKLKSEDPGSDIAGGLATLELMDVKPAAQAAGTPAGTAHYESFDGLSTDLTLTKQDGTVWAVITAQGTGTAAKPAADITARTKGWAYGLSDPRAATLETKLTDLLDTPAAKAPAAAGK